MSTPNAEQFAKAVLWQLAGLRADVSALNIRLKALQTEIGHEARLDLLDETLEKHRIQCQEDIYREAAQECGLVPPDTTE